MTRPMCGFWSSVASASAEGERRRTPSSVPPRLKAPYSRASERALNTPLPDGMTDAVPNLIRVLIGETSADGQADTVVELSANIDDSTGEVIGAAIEKLLTAGCVDAWAAPIVMKKSRPAWMLSALCTEADVAAVQFRHEVDRPAALFDLVEPAEGVVVLHAGVEAQQGPEVFEVAVEQFDLEGVGHVVVSR